MKYVLIIHRVGNYQSWKVGFDKAAELRKNAGEINYKVLRYEDQPNRVVHFSQWHSHEKAKLFFESEEVAAIRTKLGVESPEFIYLSELESGIL